MSVHITSDCISCGLCVPICPNRAIAELLEGDPLIQHEANFVVDSTLCTECHGFYDEPQCIAQCPTDAIPIGVYHPETSEQLEEKARVLGDFRESIGLPRNIAYAESEAVGLNLEKGFGPKPAVPA